MDADIRALERQDWRLAIRSPRAGGRMTKWLNPFQTKEQRRKVINHILLRDTQERAGRGSDGPDVGPQRRDDGTLLAACATGRWNVRRRLNRQAR
jgi:hypothetical protein